MISNSVNVFRDDNFSGHMMIKQTIINNDNSDLRDVLSILYWPKWYCIFKDFTIAMIKHDLWIADDFLLMWQLIIIHIWSFHREMDFFSSSWHAVIIYLFKQFYMCTVLFFLLTTDDYRSEDWFEWCCSGSWGFYDVAVMMTLIQTAYGLWDEYWWLRV